MIGLRLALAAALALGAAGFASQALAGPAEKTVDRARVEAASDRAAPAASADAYAKPASDRAAVAKAPAERTARQIWRERHHLPNAR